MRSGSRATTSRRAGAARLADGVLGRLPGGLAGLASSLWLEKQG